MDGKRKFSIISLLYLFNVLYRGKHGKAVVRQRKRGGAGFGVPEPYSLNVGAVAESRQKTDRERISFPVFFHERMRGPRFSTRYCRLYENSRSNKSHTARFARGRALCSE